MRFLQTCFPMMLLVLCSFANAQQKKEKSLYDYFDNAVGIKNLGINNGPIHTNPYRSSDDTHRYFIADRYFIGNVVYDAQPYASQNLKYDIVSDILIAKINDPNNTLGINLIQAKTAGFTFDGRKFTNLNYNRKTPQFVKGYYEEYAASPTLALYIKYRKDQIEVLKNEGVFYRYENTIRFVVRHNDRFRDIKDAGDMISLFPEYESSLNDYYQMNRTLEKTDRIQFMKNMVKYVNNLLGKDTK